MRPLVVDMTHGGVTIALELKRLYSEVHAWDIYGTLNDNERSELSKNGVEIVDGLIEGFDVIAPVHCPINVPVITHHEITGMIIEPWKKSLRIPVIEVTGVKGKTSTVWILKEILKDSKPLILSSIGAFVGEKLLKRDISITPASIIETIKLSDPPGYGSAIFEVSLGGTGAADVGVLTNIVEDYPIKGGAGNASTAKSQIFKSRLVCCDHETLKRYYPEYSHKTNTFSVRSKEANVHPVEVEYDLMSTRAEIRVNNLRTITERSVDTQFPIKTFAPAEHHLSNVLAAVTAALTLGLDPENVKGGVEKFEGLPGRTSIRKISGRVVIEEINPGLNVSAIKYTLEMAKSLQNPVIILGGKYGVTCEDIDEDKLVSVINNYLKTGLDLMLVDDLGWSIREKLGANLNYFNSPEDALKLIEDHQTAILIYRSIYSDSERR